MQRRVLPLTVEPSSAALFDGDRSSAVTAAQSIRVEFERPIRFRGLSVFGQQRANLTVRAERNGVSESIDGLNNLNARSGAGVWARFDASAAIEAKIFTLQWQPTEAGSRLEELEFWADGQPNIHVPGTTLADDLRAPEHQGARQTVPALPESWTINEETVHDRHEVGEFRFSLGSAQSGVSAARCLRAFIEYDLEGMEHWSNLSRSINDLPELVGVRQQRLGSGGHQVEEVSPSVLRDGENTVRFLPIAIRPGIANTQGYSVRNVRATCVTDPARIEDDALLTDRGRASVLALTDSSDATAIHVAPGARADNGTAWWTFGTPTQLQQVFLKISAGTQGSLSLIADDHGSASTVTLQLRGLAAGWNTLRIPPGLRSAERYRVELHGEGESPLAVSELELAGSPQPNGIRAPLVLTHPLHGECQDGATYVRGFVPRAQVDGAHVVLHIGRVEVACTVLSSGEFSGEIATPPTTSSRTSGAVAVTVTATLHDGQTIDRSFEVTRCQTAAPVRNPLTALVPDLGAPYSAVIRPNEQRSLVFGGARLEVPLNAVAEETRITVRPLAPRDVPPLDPGMTNVTVRGEAFRFGPHHMHFTRDVKLSIPFDSHRLPESMRQSDVFAFYFDTAEHRWRKVDRLDVAQGELIASSTDHFTDYIAGTLSAPETPQAASFDGNTIQGIQAANPTAGVTLIAPPQANSMGTAGTSFPILVPPGRNGMQPSLSISYSSEQDSGGWMGRGWDLRLPSIEIDTRFGVPEYDGTERYLLDGALLVAAPDDPHNDASNHRVVFRRRVEGAFERIIRVGESPSLYSWQIWDRSGNFHSFGATPSGRLTKAPSGGPIFRWYLESVEDIHSNRILFLYERDSVVPLAPDGTPGEPWVQVYPTTILWTENHTGSTVNLRPYYRVEFVRENNRADVMSNARAGFDVRTRALLTDVIVKAGFEGEQIVRKYKMTYIEGDFGKSLLSRIAMYGLGGELPGAVPLYASGRSACWLRMRHCPATPRQCRRGRSS